MLPVLAVGRTGPIFGVRLVERRANSGCSLRGLRISLRNAASVSSVRDINLCRASSGKVVSAGGPILRAMSTSRGIIFGASVSVSASAFPF